MSDSTMLTPELRKASSRRRCSRVAKSYSTFLNVSMGGLGKVLLAVAPDLELQLAGERIDHGHADAVQAARHLIGVLVELSAGMELGHDDLGGGDALALVDVNRNAAAIVAHSDGIVGIEDDLDAAGMAGERLVDCVVDDLVDHVMQAGTVVGVADIHAR